MIEITQIDGLMLREMVLAGTALLERNREKVDALNVFPVPDGDTGTNMSLTMASAVREINAKEYTSASEAAAALAKGALRGARGNSGVITSQLYRGFSRALEGVDAITPMQFAQALKKGADTAYKAVMRPKEGTILTVARVIAEEAVRQAEENPDSYEELFNTIISSGEAILERTPDMLPVLKQAGVVDAGGRGLLLIYTGYKAALSGEPIETAETEDAAKQTANKAEGEAVFKDSKYTYGVRYSIINIGKKAVQSDIDLLKRQLNRIGDCLSIDGDLKRLSVTVQTNDPGKALQYGQILGDLTDMELLNLKDQASSQGSADESEHAIASAEATGDQAAAETEDKKYGMIAVSLGEGFSRIFKDLGIDAIVEGGQTMNPSIEDLQRAIDNVHAETVFVFPNNGNVILAAQQAAQICDSHVLVIPTKNVAMGIAASVAFQPDLSPEENEQRMLEAAENVRTATITYAVRDSEFEALHIKQGDIIGLHNGKVSRVGCNVHDVSVQLTNDIVTDDDSLITLYYGEETKKEDADKLAEELADIYPDCDVDVQYGGQPLYYYLIAVE